MAHDGPRFEEMVEINVRPVFTFKPLGSLLELMATRAENMFLFTNDINVSVSKTRFFIIMELHSEPLVNCTVCSIRER